MQRIDFVRKVHGTIRNQINSWCFENDETIFLNLHLKYIDIRKRKIIVDLREDDWSSSYPGYADFIDKYQRALTGPKTCAVHRSSRIPVRLRNTTRSYT